MLARPDDRCNSWGTQQMGLGASDMVVVRITRCRAIVCCARCCMAGRIEMSLVAIKGVPARTSTSKSLTTKDQGVTDGSPVIGQDEPRQ